LKQFRAPQVFQEGIFAKIGKISFFQKRLTLGVKIQDIDSLASFFE